MMYDTSVLSKPTHNDLDLVRLYIETLFHVDTMYVLVTRVEDSL